MGIGKNKNGKWLIAGVLVTGIVLSTLSAYHTVSINPDYLDGHGGDAEILSEMWLDSMMLLVWIGVCFAVLRFTMWQTVRRFAISIVRPIARKRWVSHIYTWLSSSLIIAMLSYPLGGNNEFLSFCWCIMGWLAYGLLLLFPIAFKHHRLYELRGLCFITCLMIPIIVAYMTWMLIGDAFQMRPLLAMVYGVTRLSVVALGVTSIPCMAYQYFKNELKR